MDKLCRLALSDEGFLFDPATGDSYLMNVTGTVILRALQQGLDETAIVSRLVTEYEVEPQTAARDLADFLERLKLLHFV